MMPRFPEGCGVNSRRRLIAPGSRHRIDGRSAACDGLRLGPSALAVRMQGMGIHEFTALTVDEASDLMGRWTFDARDALVAEPILKEARARLSFVRDVGLGYLDLDRSAGSLLVTVS